jgi:hypothetical protein
VDQDFRIAFPCSSILFRSVFSSQLEDGEVSLTAFHLKPKDRGELSVWKGARPAWTRLSRVRQVVSLHTGRVRDIGLEAYEDPDDEDHGLVVGLPDPYASDESFLMANRLARRLLDMSRPVAPPER